MSNDGFADNLTKIWVSQMWKDPWFGQLINTRWEEMVSAGLEENVLSYIDQLAQQLEESQELNFKKWDITQKVHDEIKLFSTYNEGIDYLKKFVSEHIAYLTVAFDVSHRLQTAPEPFEPQPEFYYSIINKGAKSYIDVNDEEKVCLWVPVEGRHTQQWELVDTGEGLYQIINREIQKAIRDNAAATGQKYEIGVQLSLAEPDATDRRQLWNIMPPVTAPGMGYVIINALTDLAWNNSGDSYDDGNPIISWHNDSGNSIKDTRQWFFVANGMKEAVSTAIPLNTMEYMVSYDRVNAILHFRTECGKELEGNAGISSLDGKVLMQFKTTESIDISSLPPDLYVLYWNTNGKVHSIKFTK